MTFKVIKYKYQCVNGDWFETDGYVETKPTTCPDDHAVDTDKILEIDRISRDTTYIKDDSGKTSGFYMCKGHTFGVTGATGTISHYDVIDPDFDQEVFSMHFTPSQDNVGDEISIDVNPNFLIGTITAPVSVDDVELNVSRSVAFAMQKGFKCNLYDKGNDISQDVGRVKSIDKVNNKITVTAPSQNVFLTGTLVRLTVPRVDGIHFATDQRIDLGENRTGGTFSKAGTRGRITYVNKTGGDKTLSFYVQHTY